MNVFINSKSKKSFKAVTAAFTVMALLIVFVLVSGGTMATPDYPDVTVNLQAPNSLTTIEVGSTLTSTTINLNEAVSSDPAAATVATSAGMTNNVHITGVSAGVVAIATGNNLGVVLTTRYQITDSGKISGYVLGNSGYVYLSGAGESQSTPVSVPAGKGSINSISWSTLNSSVATVNSATGTITAVGDGAAIIIGKFVDKWGVDRDMHVIVIVGDANGSGGGTGELVQGGDGNWYKPVGEPPNVYEKVDEDGNSLTRPPEYVYNPDGQPGNGNDQEAVKDGGNYYVEDPENIWTPVGPDGNLNEGGAVWGGPDGKPGGGDDKPVGKFDGDYWVDMGQNVWREVLGPQTLGELTGGGPDGNPATDPVTPIYEDSNGKYYVGPLGSGEDEYYYGDPVGGNGKLDSTADGLEGDDVIYYKDSDGNMTTTKPGKPIVEEPTAVDGRELTTDQTGDTVKWIEIAKNGDYSLIVRSDFVNTNANNKGQAEWQGIPFGSSNSYQGSSLQREINDWFNGRSAVENLGAGARLRSFTVSNNASSVTGSGSSDEGGLSDGFSKPTTYRTGSGNDIAFALSFTEAANFISKTYNITLGGGNASSSSTAVKNFDKLKPYAPTNSLWLRSPGTNTDTATELQHSVGRVFQVNTGTAPALVYPALWVHSDIFN